MYYKKGKEMIYITGDTHGPIDIHKLNKRYFDDSALPKKDYLIICGDFGLVWDNSPEEKYWLDWLNDKNYTTLFVDGNHECVHKDTEVLTDSGWINIAKVYEDPQKYKVASVNLNTHILDYSPIIDAVKKREEKLIEIVSSNFKQCITFNHDLVLNGKKVKAKSLLNNNYRINDLRFNIAEEKTEYKITLSNEIIEILTAIIMDGTIVDYSIKNPNSHKVRIQFHLKKPRKIVYVQNILEDSNIHYTIRTVKDNSTYICIYGDDARALYSLLNYKKEIPKAWRYMNETQFQYFLHALVNTNGSARKDRISWRTTSKHNIDIITEVCIKNNYDINVQIINNASGYKKNTKQFHALIGKGKNLISKIKYQIIDYNDYVYCLQTKNGTLVTRYKYCPCVTGNCHILLNSYPIETWDGGKVHRIRDSVLHLMRGQVFTIGSHTFFTMGGADSVDKDWRTPGKSWWPEEMPSDDEYEEAIQNLKLHNHQVDYIITHTAPTSIVNQLIPGIKPPNQLTDILEAIKIGTKYKHWYFGHFHDDRDIDEKHTLLYYNIIPLEESLCS